MAKTKKTPYQKGKKEDGCKAINFEGARRHKKGEQKG